MDRLPAVDLVYLDPPYNQHRYATNYHVWETLVRWDAPDGTVRHAEATFGEGALMMGTADHPTARLEGSSVGQGVYVCVEDVDAHYERARAAGARVVYPPEDTEWGTRRYRVLDPEGYEWSFGTYRPGG